MCTVLALRRRKSGIVIENTRKKNKRRRRYYRYSSPDDSSSDDSSSNGCHNTSRRKEIPQNHFNLNTPVFPTMYNPLVNANNTNTVPYAFYAGMRALFQHLTQLGQTPQFYHPDYHLICQHSRKQSSQHSS